jgi:hypothetical protein
MKRFFLICSILLLIGAQSMLAAQVSVHLGPAVSTGFFSKYATVQAGAMVDVSETLSFGITQRFSYGFTYREIMGMTEIRTYMFRDLFFHFGFSYLLQQSSVAAEKDFDTIMLPYLGFGLYIPLNADRTLFFVPVVEMNQSFYLSDSIRPIYTDLPFVIAGQLALAFEYRFPLCGTGVR